MAKISASVVVVALLVVLQVSTALADKICSMYDVDFTQSMAASSMLSIDPGFKVEFSEDCKVTGKGCVTQQAFKTATIEWNCTSNARGFCEEAKKGKVNICTQIAGVPPPLRSTMEALNLPTRCPMETTTTCADQSTVDVTANKNWIWTTTGNTTCDIKIVYDNDEAKTARGTIGISVINKKGMIKKNRVEVGFVKMACSNVVKHVAKVRQALKNKGKKPT